MKGLTPKQKRFADEYLVDLNGTRAYKTAYPNIKKEETAAACASKLLRKANIADYIKKQQQELQQKTKITQERVLQELANIAFSDVTSYAKIVEKTMEKSDVGGIALPVLDSEGNPVICRTVQPTLTDDLTPPQKSALAVIKQGRSGWEIRTHDKLKALELLGKHIGMFGQAAKAEETNKQLQKAVELLGGIESVIK